MASFGTHPAGHAGRRVLRVAAAGATMVGVLAMAGTATARWTTSGSGSGTGATAGGLARLTTTAVTASGTALAPNGSAPLTLRVANPSNVAVTVTSVTLDGSRSITSTGAIGTCANPALSVSSSGWSGVTVPANGTSGTITIPGAVAMGAGADNGCQGATFTIPVTLTGTS